MIKKNNKKNKKLTKTYCVLLYNVMIKLVLKNFTSQNIKHWMHCWLLFKKIFHPMKLVDFVISQEIDFITLIIMRSRWLNWILMANKWLSLEFREVKFLSKGIFLLKLNYSLNFKKFQKIQRLKIYLIRTQQLHN